MASDTKTGHNKKNNTEYGNDDTELISHRLPPEKPTPGDRWGAAVVISVVLGCMAVGPLLPLGLLALFVMGHTTWAVALAAVLVASMVTADHSPAWCRLFLRSAGWFRRGVYLHLERRSLHAMRHGPSMWCMHPHGTALGFGFALNGAVRFRANDDGRFVPEELASTIHPPGRLRQTNGVMAPLLFCVPLIRHFLLSFGCATPATKEGLYGLMRRGVDFGILPGGMEEVALYRRRRERVYLSRRAGFLKYALQHGYTVHPAYTFGEVDLYDSLEAGASVRMWMQRHLGFILPIFWGPHWGVPWLPRSDVAVHTVLGSPLVLSRIEQPTDDQVVDVHRRYQEALRTLFDTHKARFGYADRELEIL